MSMFNDVNNDRSIEMSKPDLEDLGSFLVLPEDLFSALLTGLAVLHTQWQASVREKSKANFLMT